MNGERPIAVPNALRAWSAGITFSSLDADRGPQTVIEEPDAAAALAIRSGGNGEHDLVVFGPRTRAIYTAGESGPFCVKLRIQLGRARLLLGQAISDLVDRAVPLVDVWGEDGSRLVRALAELGSDPAVLSLDPLVEPFQRVLDSRVGLGGDADRSSGHLIERAVRILSPASDVGTERVATAARRLNISDRQLRNIFADEVGVSPKRFAQIERVRAVLALARDDGLAAIAASMGYFDQSHMTAEFRRLMGVAPRAFFAGQLPAAAPCASALTTPRAHGDGVLTGHGVRRLSGFS